MKKIIVLLVLTSSIIFALSGIASAICPDKVLCRKHDGVISYVDNVPTCYKLFKGCRPWHCKNTEFTNTDQHYWEHRCAEHIAGICEDSYGRILCVVEFPLY